MSFLIIKIGGSVITHKQSETPKVNFENLTRVAKEISEAYKPEDMKLVLIHGAGSFGHQIVKRTGINNGIKTKQQLVDFAETQRLQNKLNCIVTEELIKNNLPAIPCQASASAVMDNGNFLEMDLNAVRGFLEIGLIPVLYGVPAYDRTQKCSILSGDDIAPYLAEKLNAEKIIHATDVNGIFTSDPNVDKDAELIPEITEDNFDDIKDMLSGSKAVDVTGGMLKKVSEIMRIVKYGIDVQIISALIPGNIIKAMNGEKIGTIIKNI